MKKIFLQTNDLDKNTSENLGINELVLMENAASKIETIIRKKVKKHSKILAVCGSGNNGADAICALRKLSGDYECYVYFVSKNLHKMPQIQLNIAKKVGVREVLNLDNNYKCVLDGIYGSGFSGEIDNETQCIIEKINQIKALKIAVDIPSGINLYGQIKQISFKADITVCMGALKIALFSDIVKDFVGKIIVANLGISRDKFEKESNVNLLEKSDMILPIRKHKNTNKGSFGHTYVVCGDMNGASEIAALSANAVGSGLVSIVGENMRINPIIMQKDSLKNAKVVIIGCGLGKKEVNFDELQDKTLVIDADMCYMQKTITLIEKNPNFIITPHPKEFSSLLKLANLAQIDTQELQENRFKYAKIWSENFRGVLVLKGANTIIASNGKLFVMTKGTNALAKGGSGDVLAGIIGGLLAQNYTLLDASISGVLMHAYAAKKFKKHSYSLNSFDLIKGLKCL